MKTTLKLIRNELDGKQEILFKSEVSHDNHVKQFAALPTDSTGRYEIHVEVDTGNGT